MALSKIDLANMVENDLAAGSQPLTIIENKINFRNILINTDMSVCQRATPGTGITGSGYHTIDMFRTTAGSAGTWTQSQDTTVPSGQGFGTSLKMDCTTANGSLSAGSYLIIEQRVEGQNLQYLKKGTSSAESTTISFWVRSNKTGTYIAALNDTDNSRYIAKSYTISSADTWEKKTLTFAGDTSGAFNNDNLTSLKVQFWLAAGTTYTSGTLATSWESATNANQAVGQVNLADSTSNEWYITGIQLESGTSASDFEHIPADVNLSRCQRYFERTTAVGASDNYINFASGVVQNSSYCTYCFLWKTKKRVQPTMSSTAASTFLNENGASYPAGSSISFSQINKTSAQCDLSSSSGITLGRGCIMKSNGTNDAFISASAEL